MQRVVASADWLGKDRSPVRQVAGRVLIGKFEPVSGKLLKGRRRGLRFLRFSRKGGQVGDIVTQDGGHRTRWSRPGEIISNLHMMTATCSNYLATSSLFISGTMASLP
ncbi:uncharacterized protein LOC132691726 [Panthera onca]